jgi:ketosteroid isomerase-like protein
MPQDNAKTIAAAYEAFARRDIPFITGLLDPQVVWMEAENFIYADRNPYRGPQAVLDGVFGRVASEWDNFTATSEELVCAGDTVVSLGRYRGTYKATGAKVNAQFVHVFKLRGDKIVGFQQYTDTAQFSDAVSRGRSVGA